MLNSQSHNMTNTQQLPTNEDDLSATELMTTVMCEQLQLSGEKDRLKSILVEDLRTHGWTETMFKAAAKATAVHQAQHEAGVSTSPSKSNQSLTAFQLAQLIAKPGHDNVPEAVRARLFQTLITSVREFVSQADYESADANNDAVEKEN